VPLPSLLKPKVRSVCHLEQRQDLFSTHLAHYTYSSTMDNKLEDIAAQIKFDILTPTQDVDNEKLIEEVSRSFISDTITVPTKEMYAYAVRTSVGDDVYHEPSMLALEAHMAKIAGKEAAMFIPSGTMSNQLALRTHLQQPPYSVICDVRGHINKYEAGGTSFHSGAHLICVNPSNGGFFVCTGA